MERAWMLALAEYRKTRCQGCGGDLAETTDEANDGRYLPMPPVMCHRCVAFEISHKQFADQPHAMSLMHRVELRRG